MYSSWLTLPFALVLSPFVHGIPVAPQQALLDIQRGQSDATSLINGIVDSDLNSARIAYATVQHTLDNLGMYLGQLTDSTCLSSTPSSYDGTSHTSKDSVIQALQSMQLGLSSLTLGITDQSQDASVSAWQTAQQSLSSTYDYIFEAAGDTTSASKSVYAYIQAAQTALNSLSADVVRSDFPSARQHFGTVYSQLNSDIGPAVPCSPFSSNVTTCISATTPESDVEYTDVLICIQNVQMALNRLAQDALTGEPSTEDCELAGGDLAATYNYIHQ